MNTALRATILASMAFNAVPAALASGINGINNGMPNRLSMNVTVPRQTQGATFGEKVGSGLHAAGNIVASGASFTIECGASACVVALPDGNGYRADLGSMSVTPLAAEQGLAVRKAGGGAALVGGALPGGSILSAAVSSVSSLAGGGGSGAAAASYAATGRSAAARDLASSPRGDGNIDVTEPLTDGDYALTLEVARVVEKATSGLKDTLKTQVRLAPPVASQARVRMRLVFGVVDGVLSARPESADNAVSLVN